MAWIFFFCEILFVSCTWKKNSVKYLRGIVRIVKWFFLVSDSFAFINDVDCLNKKGENTWLSVLWKNILCKIIIPYSHKTTLHVFLHPLPNHQWPKGNILCLCQTKYWIAAQKNRFLTDNILMGTFGTQNKTFFEW